MAMVKVTSALEANIPKNLNTTSVSNFQDASFSSYLNGTEETFVLKLDSSRNLSKKADDEEIDIFSAEKYFNEGVDEENQENTIIGDPQNKHKIDEPNDIASLKHKTRSTTPSIYSESSWNSRSQLLRNFSRNHQQPSAKHNNKSYGKKFLARIGCNCYCKDKEAVEVDNQVGKNSFNSRTYHGKSKQNKHIKTRSLAQSFESSTTGSSHHQDLHFKKVDELGFVLKKDEPFSMPVFDPKAGNPGMKIQLQQEEETRRSLEVFGLPITEKERKKMSLEKSLSMLTWDAIAPKHDEIDIINIGASSNGTYEDDYAESDASSDLFEIESFPSNNTGNYPSFARQVSDGMSSCVTPTTCYAPSEVSIEWSVVTASAADFSIMSDSEELKIPSIRNNSNRIVHNGKETTGKDKSKRRSGTFLGCSSHKAVGVVGDTYNVSEKTSMELPQRHLKTESIMPMTRFHAESKLNRFDGGNRKHDFSTRPFSSSHTGRPADFLYI